MKEKQNGNYPISLFVIGFLLNLIKNFWLLFSGLILLITGIWVKWCIAVGLVALLVAVSVSFVQQIQIRNTLINSDNSNFDEYKNAVLSSDWKKNVRDLVDERKKQCKSIPEMPSWNKIIEILYDKQLDFFVDKVTNVLYSKDKSMRYVILKNEKGIFTYKLQAIYQFDEDAWKYISDNDDALPATWESYLGSCEVSRFANEDDLMNDLESQPEYKQYFI